MTHYGTNHHIPTNKGPNALKKHNQNQNYFIGRTSLQNRYKQQNAIALQNYKNALHTCIQAFTLPKNALHGAIFPKPSTLWCPSKCPYKYKAKYNIKNSQL